MPATKMKKQKNITASLGIPYRSANPEEIIKVLSDLNIHNFFRNKQYSKKHLSKIKDHVCIRSKINCIHKIICK